MSTAETLYERLPVALQNVVCSGHGFSIQTTRFGRGFREALDRSESRSLSPARQIRTFRDERIAAFVRHAASTVPYYGKAFRDLGVDPAAIRGIDDLVQLPILDKAFVQKDPESFQSGALAGSKCRTAHTSGTSGAGLRFLVTQQSEWEQWATWWRYRRWHGIQQGTLCGYFGGRQVVPIGQKKPPFWRFNFPGRQILFSGYHISPANIGSYLETLRTQRPPWLHGYPSILAMVAAYIQDSGARLGYQVKFITIGAENLLPQQAEVIERAFGVKPIQHYGMAEGVANISECPSGALHVDEDFSAVEFVEDALSGSLRVIGTNFTNLATPLLRYDVGDRVTIHPSASCACGRPGRVVQQIDGRAEDYIVLTNGARLGRLDHVFKDMVNVREAQLYQPKVGVVVVRLVRGDRFSDADETLLIAEFRRRLDRDTKIELDYRDSLPRSKSGKLKFVVSDVAPSDRLGHLAS